MNRNDWYVPLWVALLCAVALTWTLCASGAEESATATARVAEAPVDPLPIFLDGTFTPRNDCFQGLLAADGYLADVEYRITERSTPGFGRGPLDRWMDRVDLANREIHHLLSQSPSSEDCEHLLCLHQGITRVKELMIQHWTSTVDWLEEHSPNVEVGEDEEVDMTSVVEFMQWLDDPYKKLNEEKSP